MEDYRFQTKLGAHHRSAFHEDKHVTWRNALGPDWQLRQVGEELRSSSNWGLRWCDTTGTRIIKPEELEVAGTTAFEMVKRGCSREERISSQSFGYAFPVLIPGWEQEPEASRLLTFIDHSVRVHVNKELGLETTHTEEMLASWYTAGSYLRAHTDGVGNRRVAFVLHLGERWELDAGGFLMVKRHMGEDYQCLHPEFGTLHLLNTKDGGAVHFVSPVARWAQGGRLALTGWFAD